MDGLGTASMTSGCLDLDLSLACSTLGLLPLKGRGKQSPMSKAMLSLVELPGKLPREAARWLACEMSLAASSLNAVQGGMGVPCSVPLMKGQVLLLLGPGTEGSASKVHPRLGVVSSGTTLFSLSGA
jgi:hypothetical protein